MLILIWSGIVANAAAPALLVSTQAATTATHPANEPPPPPAPNEVCASRDSNSIVVCAQRPQGYRIDPSVMEARRQVETNGRSATSAAPPAQAVCSTQPTGCSKNLGSLDLVNVALVAGTTAVRAAEGKDWTRTFKTGGPDEYQLYKEARQRREAQEAARTVAQMKAKAKATEQTETSSPQ